jgi:hypothetical protein
MAAIFVPDKVSSLSIQIPPRKKRADKIEIMRILLFHPKKKQDSNIEGRFQHFYGCRLSFFIIVKEKPPGLGLLDGFPARVIS